MAVVAAHLSNNPRAKSTRDTEKRDRAILAAEKLFAQEGYHGVSMRDIAKEADVGLPLIVYHFETKLNLYREIFEFRKGAIQERLDELSRITDLSAADAVEKIVHAFVAPIIKSHATPDGMYHAQLVVREASDPQEATRGIIAEYFDPTARAFIGALAEALPHASHEYIAWAYLFAVGTLVMSDFDGRMIRISNGKYANRSVAKKISMLTKFVVGGIRAGA
ncbi:CerR family C-terminal domain-containing protein [Caballeronia sp. LjRoot34]|uniref:TetR/AcrR family transcriptional regulator n=1 Tax=Caballeronia sp. LjRoot34 TaxID=3342325 RepID=UPI003ED0C5F0